MPSWERLVWAVPILVALLGLYRPRWALFAFVGCLPLFGSPPGGPYLGALEVAALAVVVTSFRARQPPRSALSWPVLALLGVALASLVPLAYQPPSWQPRVLLGLLAHFPGVESWTALYTWRAAVTLLTGAALFYATRRLLEPSHLPTLGVSLAVGLGVLEVVGLLEQLQLVDLSSYRAIGPLIPEERLHSLFFNSGWLAEYVVLAAPVAVAGLVAAGWRRTAALLGGLSLVVLLLAQQRGGWFTALFQLTLLAIPLLLVAVRGRLRWRPVVLGGLVAGALLAGVLILSPADRLAALGERLNASFTDLAGREALWEASLELTQERPLLGWGIGSFAPAYDALHPPRAPEAHRPRGTAHNWALNALAETGVLGLLAWLALAWALGRVLLRAGLAGDRERRVLAWGLGIGFAGAAFYGAVQYMPFLRNIHWLLWTLAGAVACLEESTNSRARWNSWVAMAILAVAALLIPWRAQRATPSWRGNLAYGFHEPERSGGRAFQWMGARAAERIPWTGNCLRVPLANGHPLGGKHPVTVHIRAAGASEVVTELGGWRGVVLNVGPPQASSVVVELTAQPTFRPFSDYRQPGLPDSRDVRELGVAVGEIATVECAAVEPQPQRRLGTSR